MKLRMKKRSKRMRMHWLPCPAPCDLPIESSSMGEGNRPFP